MSPALRKLVLTAHVTSSVGWLGAVVAFLALALGPADSAGGLAVLGWSAIVPLALAALVTGAALSVGTEWGLVRHYWVLIKLALTVLATIGLLVHMQLIDRAPRAQLALDAIGAIAMLLVATALSIYKPRGAL